MTDKPYHPVPRCEKAKDLYFAWVKIAQLHPKNSKERIAAFEEYHDHIHGGCNCREGLDEVR